MTEDSGGSRGETMFQYRICDCFISSSIELPELIPSKEKNTHVHFELSQNGSFTDTTKISWFHDWKFPLETIPWLKLGRSGNNYILRFQDLAEFQISENLTHITARTSSQTPPHTLRHLLYDQVIPLIFSHGGKIVLHASAVRSKNGAILFADNSGLGKSSIAAFLSQHTFSLLSDDFVLINKQLQAIPSYPGCRLSPQYLKSYPQNKTSTPVCHYNDKRRVAATFTSTPTPLQLIFCLESSESAQPKITQLKKRDAMVSLLKLCFRLDLKKESSSSYEFTQLSKIIESTPVFKLHYPKNEQSLPLVQELIEDLSVVSKAG